MKQRKGKNNDVGEVMLESLIVYSITILLLFFILAVFSVLFQRWNIQTIANEAATRVAQTYKLMDADTVTGHATKDQITNVSHYRYLWKSQDLERVASEKIKKYAANRLAKTTYTKNVVDPEIEVNVKRDALSRRHIEVSIKGKYAVPFGEVLSYFGFNSIIEYQAVAYARCLDIIDYINTVGYVGNVLTLDVFDSKFIGMVDEILELIEHSRTN